MKAVLLSTFGLALSLSAQTPAPAEPAPPTQRTIYVPYEDLEKVFTDGGKGVFLPYREFLDLWNQLQAKPKDDDIPPPTDGVLSRAEYVGKVEGSTLVLTATITAESFKSKGWTTLPLSTQALASIADAQTGKAVLRTKTDGSGTEIFLPEKGRYDLTLTFMLPITAQNGISSLSLALPRAAVNKLTIELPGKDMPVSLQPSAAYTTRTTAGGTELSLFFGPSGESPKLTWGSTAASTTMTALLLSDTAIESTIRPASIASSIGVSLSVLRASMNEFKLSLPATTEVLGVEGTGIKSWNVLPAKDRQQLIITLDQAVKGALAFQLNVESPITALPAQVAVPDVIVEGATYSRGSIALRTEPQFDVTPGAMTSIVRQATTAYAPAGLLATGSFRVLKQPFALALQVEEAKPQVEVASIIEADVARDVLNLTTTFTYQIKRVGIFELRIGVPAGQTITDVTGGNLTEWKVTGDTLNVKLPSQHQGELVLTVRSKQARKEATQDLTVPLWSPQEVVRHEGKVNLSIHSSLEVNITSKGEMTEEDYTAGPREMIANGIPQNRSTLALRYRDAAKPAALAFKARAPQVSATVLTLIEAREQSTKHAWTLQFNVAYAAIDHVLVAVPKAVASELRLIDPNVKEILKDVPLTDAVKAKLPDADTYALWDVRLRSEKVGAFDLTLTHEKQGALEAGKTGSIALLQVHIPEAFQEVGQLAVVKDNALELRNAKPEGLEEIDARELTGVLAQPGVFQAYKYRSLPIALTLDTAKNDYLPLPQAVITHADLLTSVASDEAQTTEVIYWMKNVDLQFLVVTLPAKAHLLGYVHIGKESQQPMRRDGSSDLLVRLPTGAKEAFSVRFVFQTDSANAGQRLGMSGTLAIQPAIASQVEVLQTRHRLFLPDGRDYLSFEGPLMPAYAERSWPQVWRTFKQAVWWLPVDTLFGLIFRQPDHVMPAQWDQPPSLANDVRQLFDVQVQEQGVLHTLHRLGAPALISIGHRSRGLSFAWEAIAFVLAIGAGWWFARERRLLFVMGGFVLGLLIIALLSAGYAVFAIGMLRALGLLIIVWVAQWLWSLWQGWQTKRRNGKPKPPPPTAPVAPTSPPMMPMMGNATTSGGNTTVLEVPPQED